MNEDRVRVGSASPATVASGKVFSVGSLEGNLGSHYFESPGRGRSGEGSRVRIGSRAAFCADAEVLSVISEEVD